MSLDNTNLQGGISLAAGFNYQAEAPLDKRFTVKNITGLTELVNGNAAYNGLQVYVESTHETYRLVNGTWIKLLEENDINALVNTKVAEAQANAMEFIGVITELPTGLTEADNGHFYKVVKDIPLTNEEYSFYEINKEFSSGYGSSLPAIEIPVAIDPSITAGEVYLEYVINNVDEPGHSSPLPKKVEVILSYIPADDSGDISEVQVIEIGDDGRGKTSFNFFYAPNEAVIRITPAEYTDGCSGYINTLVLSSVDPISVNNPVIKEGDSVVWNGYMWYVIPAGDSDTDTWRTIKINDAGIGRNELNLKNGTNVTLSNLNGEVTISAVDTKYTADEASLHLANTQFSIKEEGVETKHIKDEAVTTDKIDNEAVTTDKIADGAVTNTKLEVNSVITEKIADGNVTEEKLAADVKTKLNKTWQPIGDYKTEQSAIDNKITKAAHVLSSLTQDKNGEISYAVKELTPADIGAKAVQTAVVDPTANGKSLTFIDTLSQDEQGVITATKKNVNLDDYALKTEIPNGTGTAGIASVTDNIVTIKGNATLTGHTLANGNADDVTLAKVAKTGSIYDIAEGVNTNTGADKTTHPKYIIFNCGSATEVI